MNASCNMPVYIEGSWQFLCHTVTKANSVNGTKIQNLYKTLNVKKIGDLKVPVDSEGENTSLHIAKNPNQWDIRPYKLRKQFVTVWQQKMFFFFLFSIEISLPNICLNLPYGKAR